MKFGKKVRTIGKKSLGLISCGHEVSDDDAEEFDYYDDVSDDDSFWEGSDYGYDDQEDLDYLVHEYNVDQEYDFPQANLDEKGFQEGIFDKKKKDDDGDDDDDDETPPPPYAPPLGEGKSKGSPPRVFKVLLLGGTGTGKSTMINTIANYFLNGTPENPKVVIPTKYLKVTEKDFNESHSEEKIDDVTKSKTTKCYTYVFAHPQNPAYKFAFIDTPGMSDTNGVEQDDKNIQEIITTAIRAGSLSAIAVISNGTEARVTTTIKNTLVRLANNLPDALIDNNLLLILTKCGKASACFSVNDFAKEIAKPKRVFYMDNQAFSNDPQIWLNDEEECQLVKLHWGRSNQTIHSFLKTITKMSTTSTKAFAIMKMLRDKIKTEIAKVSQDVANIQKVQECLDAAQKALEKTGDQKKSFSNYTTTEKITLMRFVPADYHSTVCITHMRENIICHDHCGLEFNTQVGGNIFRSCLCMSQDNQCRVCECGAQSHVHQRIRLVTETNSIRQVLEDMKAQYEMADQQHKKISADANSYQSTLDDLQAAVDSEYEKIQKLCEHLSKVCSRFNFVNELHANLENMRQDARAIQNADVRKRAESEIHKLEELANGLSSRQRNF